jgi:hypothetical protein
MGNNDDKEEIPRKQAATEKTNINLSYWSPHPTRRFSGCLSMRGYDPVNQHAFPIKSPLLLHLAVQSSFFRIKKWQLINWILILTILLSGQKAALPFHENLRRTDLSEDHSNPYKPGFICIRQHIASRADQCE